MKGSTGTAGRLINEGVLSHNRAAVLKEASEIQAKALKICWRCQGERPVAEGREEQLGPGLRRFTCVSCLPPGTDLRPKTRVLKEAASLRRLEKEKVRILKEAILGATRKQREETQARLKRKLEERKKAEAAARRAEKSRLRDERDAVTRKEREEIREAAQRLARKVLEERAPLSLGQQLALEIRKERASSVRKRKTPEDRQRELEAEADRQYYESEDFPDLLE